MVERDVRRVTDVLLDWSDEPGLDEEQLAQDVDAFVDRYHGLALEQGPGQATGPAKYDGRVSRASLNGS